MREPATADPEDVARKLAAAPDLHMPPPPEWILDENGRVIDYRMQGMACGARSATGSVS